MPLPSQFLTFSKCSVIRKANDLVHPSTWLYHTQFEMNTSKGNFSFLSTVHSLRRLPVLPEWMNPVFGKEDLNPIPPLCSIPQNECYGFGLHSESPFCPHLLSTVLATFISHLEYCQKSTSAPRYYSCSFQSIIYREAIMISKLQI